MIHGVYCCIYNTCHIKIKRKEGSHNDYNSAGWNLVFFRDNFLGIWRLRFKRTISMTQSTHASVWNQPKTGYCEAVRRLMDRDKVEKECNATVGWISQILHESPNVSSLSVAESNNSKTDATFWLRSLLFRITNSCLNLPQDVMCRSPS